MQHQHLSTKCSQIQIILPIRIRPKDCGTIKETFYKFEENESNQKRKGNGSNITKQN
jgi:hypothetical protein